jgi:hypothetical protein
MICQVFVALGTTGVTIDIEPMFTCNYVGESDNPSTTRKQIG